MSNFPSGEGFFETIQTHNRHPVALDPHLARARASAVRLGVAFPSDEKLERLVLETLSVGEESEYGRLRIVFSMLGKVEMSHESYEMWNSPAKVGFVSDVIVHNSTTRGIKSLPYTVNLSLLEKAKQEGFDEVIRCDENGQVSEGAVSNLVFRIGGQWLTPDLSSGCLPGIIRGICIAKLGVEEAVLRSEDVGKADSAYLLSSLKLAQPISHIGVRNLEIVTDFAEQVRNCMARL